ncbi:MAG: phosphatidylglycerophosphatase A [Nibricoccus sp.]
MSFAHPIWPRFLPTPTVLALARLGPVGRLKAPGTWGSLAGLMYQLVFFLYLPPIVGFLCTLPGLWLAVAMCGEAEFRLGRRDPGEVVLDEFVVMPLCFLGWKSMHAAFVTILPAWATQGPWVVLLAGFALFRFFDILKPLGISKLQNLPGGWGVVADDAAAALATCATLHGAALAIVHFGH